MKNNDDIKKLLEAFDRTEQWRGEDPNPPNGKLVGEEAGGFLGGHFNSDDQVREEEGVAGAERNREMGHAKIDLIRGREGEQRRVWQQHYDRAIRNGRDKARARQYADSMTGSEHTFGEGEEITEREAGAGYGDNTQRGTPPWMMPGSDGGDGNDGKKTSFQLAGDDKEENVFVDEEVVDEYGADVANDMATPDVQPQLAQQQQPKTYGDVRGKLSPAARNMFAQRQLSKMSQQDQENNPFESVDSSKYATTEELAEALTKAYEDYVGDPYSENNVIPKANKHPGKDVPKAKKAKRQPEPNELAESPKCPECDGRGTIQGGMASCPRCHGDTKPPVSQEENKRRYDAQLAQQRADRAKKKEKPFRDAAATGNRRDFANESNADDERDERRDARVPADEPEYKWDGVNRPAAAMHNGRRPEKKKEKPVAEAGKKKSENRELWDRIKARGTTRGVDRERYTDMSGEGLEGPFPQKNGQVLYYDPKEGKYYNRDTDMYVDQSDYDAMNEGDPDVPMDVHKRNKEKDREAFQRAFARGAGERTKKAVDAGVQQFMKRPITKPEQAVSETSGRFSQLAHLRAKFESISSKLQELKGQKALKEAPIDQTVAPVAPGQQPQQQQGAAPATTVAPTPGAAANPATAGATQPAVPAKPAASGTPVAAQAAVPNMVAGIKQSMQPAAFNNFKQTVAKS
jgi:hypothetical protein